MKPGIGVWVDCPINKVITPQYWDLLKDHGISTAAIMLESVAEGFEPKYTLAQLTIIGNRARERDIEIVLTAWPEPNKAWMYDFESKIMPLLEAAGASGLELDAESNWMARKLRDFPTMRAATDSLVVILYKIRAKLDVRIEMTTFTEHPENSKESLLGPAMDRLLPQAYSVRHRSNGEVGWLDTYGPGKMQVRTLDRTIQVRGAPIKPKVSCGVAAYDQIWPGYTGEEAMRKAYNATLAYRPIEIRLWSSKWIVGAQRNGYSARFLLKLKAEV